MTQPNQSELDGLLSELGIGMCKFKPDSDLSPDSVKCYYCGGSEWKPQHTARATLNAYITANYTPNSEVEHLTPHLTPHLSPQVVNDELLETILSILGITDRTIGNRPAQIATLKQELGNFITQQTTAARIDEIDWCRNEVENDIPINVYDKLSERLAQLQKEVK